MKCPRCNGTGQIDGTLGDRIRALAEARGASMPDVEHGARLSHATLWRLLSSKNPKGASLDSLTKLADFFGVSLDELVGRKKDVLLGDTQKLVKKYFESRPVYQPDICGICGKNHGGLECPLLTPMSINTQE